ncbi:MAG: type II toxin-antitoxin system VapC family toxin [Deltaproteobacteria bacterium]
MAHTQRPPRYTHSFIDSCAFNPGGTEGAASRRILEKWPNIILAHSVQKELEHPNTPDDVKRMAQAFVYTIEIELTPELLNKRDQVRILVQGNAKPRKHKGDADHLFELYKYGGGYFVTTDERLLSRSGELFKKYFITTIKPSEYEKLL